MEAAFLANNCSCTCRSDTLLFHRMHFVGVMLFGVYSCVCLVPQMNMLMRLQEAASYSSPHSGESDSASVDNQSIDSTVATPALHGGAVNMESTL